MNQFHRPSWSLCSPEAGFPSEDRVRALEDDGDSMSRAAQGQACESVLNSLLSLRGWVAVTAAWVQFSEDPKRGFCEMCRQIGKHSGYT